MKNGCVVGMGAIGPVHAQILQQRGSLYGICENQPKRLNRFSPENKALKRYADFAEVLKEDAIDVVHICTPHYLHKEMAQLALEAGKDVVLEKPVTMKKEELPVLCETAEKTGGKVCVMLQNRLNPSVVRLKRFLEEDNSLGKLLGITGMMTWRRDAAYYAQDAWRGRIATEGGGVLINQAIHTIDLLGYLGGRICKVRSSISNKTLNGIIEVEDTADAILESENGIRMCFYATNGCAYDRPVQLEVQMEKGLLRYADGRLYRISENECSILAQDMKKSSGKTCWGGSHTEAITQFYEYLETGTGRYISLADSVDSMEALFATYESAKKDKTVYL